MAFVAVNEADHGFNWIVALEIISLIDTLLELPQYGEKWARHWLDLVRYADSDGYRADHFRPEAWRYRDYVIASFNADKPYDRFVRQQLAADFVATTSPDDLAALGFINYPKGGL